jgi:hypothetical protein
METNNWVIAKNFVYEPQFSVNGVWGRRVGSIDGIPVYIANQDGVDVDHVYMAEIRGMGGSCGSRTGIIVGGVQHIGGVCYVKRVQVGKNSRRIVFAVGGVIQAQAFNVRSIVHAAKRHGRRA